MEPLISTLFFPLQAAAPATNECFQLRHFVAPLLSILSPEMERSTLSASRGAHGASRGLVVRPRAARRFCANVDSSSSSSTLRSSSSLVGPRRWNQQPRILLVRAAPSTPSGSAGDESDVLKLHEELLAQVRNLKNCFRNRVFLAPTERICLATKDEKTSTTSFLLLSFSYLPLFSLPSPRNTKPHQKIEQRKSLQRELMDALHEASGGSGGGDLCDLMGGTEPVPVASSMPKKGFAKRAPPPPTPPRARAAPAPVEPPAARKEAPAAAAAPAPARAPARSPSPAPAPARAPQTPSPSPPPRAAAPSPPPAPAVPPAVANGKQMNIVFVAAEMAPWSKTGGLGDVMGE